MKHHITVLALLASLGLICAAATNLEIIGGEEANIEDFPYQVSFRIYNWHFCGASLIAPSFVITAAHCTINKTIESMSVLAGATNRWGPGQTANVSEVYQHPDYKTFNHDNDCSILRLEKPLLLTPTVQTVHLPAPGDEPPEATLCTVTGWGALTEKYNRLPDILHKVDLPFVHRDVCRKYVNGITDNMVCAGYPNGGKDTCQGDSGGPLVCEKKLVGIVSWGDGCARRSKPGVYTKVANLRDFIKRIADV